MVKSKVKITSSQTDKDVLLGYFNFVLVYWQFC